MHRWPPIRCSFFDMVRNRGIGPTAARRQVSHVVLQWRVGMVLGIVEHLASIGSSKTIAAAVRPRELE